MFSAKRCLLGRVGGQECSVLVGLLEVERWHLREVVVWEGSAWRSPWSRGMDTWRFGRQTQVLKDLADDRWVFDGGDDFGFAAAIRADFDIDIEGALEEPCPGDAGF